MATVQMNEIRIKNFKDITVLGSLIFTRRATVYFHLNATVWWDKFEYDSYTSVLRI